MYLHTHTRSYRRESDHDRHTHTPMPNLGLTCAQTHTSRGASFIALPGALHDTHTLTHTSSYELEICLTMTHTYTHPYPRLVALQNTYFSFTFTGAFLLHATGVLISSVCDESSQQRQSYCRLYCETSGRYQFVLKETATHISIELSPKVIQDIATRIFQSDYYTCYILQRDRVMTQQCMNLLRGHYYMRICNDVLLPQIFLCNFHCYLNMFTLWCVLKYAILFNVVRVLIVQILVLNIERKEIRRVTELLYQFCFLNRKLYLVLLFAELLELAQCTSIRQEYLCNALCYQINNLHYLQ